MVGVRDRDRRAEWADVVARDAAAVLCAVRDDDRHVLAALHAADRAVGDLPVRGEVGLVAAVGGDVEQEDVVAVRVDPVRQHVVRRGAPRFDRDRRRALLHGRGVHIEVVHGEGDRCRRLAAPAILDRVTEGRRPARVGGRGDLQRGAVVDGLDRSERRRLRDGCHEHIAVGVGVVVEHRQHGRAARTDAVLVVLGDRRRVLVGALGEGRLHRLFGGLLLVLAVAFGRGDVLPVVDPLQGVGGHPRRSSEHVVQDDHVPVRAEPQHARRLDARNLLGEVVGLARAVADEAARPRPGAVGASGDEHGLGGRALATAGGDRGGVAAAERHAHEVRGRG